MERRKKMALPKLIYVYEETDGDKPFLLAEKSFYAAAEKGEKRIIGVYELKEKKRVQLLAEITK
jgi:hypothetical protein